MDLKATMVYDEVNDKYIYFDRNGVMLQDGDIIVYADGREEKVYESISNVLDCLYRLFLVSLLC